MTNRMVLNIGDIYNVPLAVTSSKGKAEIPVTPISSTIVYIHPFGRYVTVEHCFRSGAYRESSPITPTDKLDMLKAGVIQKELKRRK